MQKQKNRAIMAVAVYLVLWSAVWALGDEYANERALRNISAARTYFDVNMGTAGKLVTRLKLIDATYGQLVAANVRPQFVIGFRGKATRFVTKGDDYVLEEDLPAKKEVAAWINRFKERGIPMEQCYIAAQLMNVEAKDILPEIELVKNGYVSMIGYQTKGYVQIPMD